MEKLIDAIVNLRLTQIRKLSKGLKTNSPINIRVSSDQLKPSRDNGFPIVLYPEQIKKYIIAKRLNKGMNISFDKKQMEAMNTKREGGIGPLAAMLIQALIPTVVKLGSDAVRGVVKLIKGGDLAVGALPSNIESPSKAVSLLSDIQQDKTVEVFKPDPTDLQFVDGGALFPSGRGLKSVSVKYGGQLTMTNTGRSIDLTDKEMEQVSNLLDKLRSKKN